MSKNLILFTFGLFLISPAPAYELKSYSDYKLNHELIEKDLASLNTTRLLAEDKDKIRLTLLNMDLETPPLKQFEKLRELAVGKKWSNIELKTNELQKECQLGQTKESACLKMATDFIAFVTSSTLTQLNKDLVIKNIQQAVSEWSDTSNLLKSRENEFNQYTLTINEKLKQLEINNPASQNLIKPKSKMPITKPNRPTPQPLEGSPFSLIDNNHIIAFVVGCCAFAFMIFLFNRRQKKKKEEQLIQYVYSKIFYQSKQNDLKVRVFGKLMPLHLSAIMKVEKPLMQIVSSAKSMTNHIEIKFKDKEKEKEKLFFIELTFISNLTLNTFSKEKADNNFDLALFELKSQIEAIGGHLSLIVDYSKVGEVKQSTLITALPIAQHS